MPIKYSTYDSSSGNEFALTTISGVSGTFTDQLSGNIYKTTGGVVVISGSGDVKPYGLFSFPNISGSSGTFLVASTSGSTEWRATKNVNYQLFNSNDTWTKPSGVSVVYVELIGGGAGGNSGANEITSAFGGGGGAPGTFLWQTFNASNISGTVTVTVGAGGSGQPSVTSSGSGVIGFDGGASSFGDYLNSLTTRSSSEYQFSSSGSLRGLLTVNTANGGNGAGGVGGTALFAGGGGGGGRQGTTSGSRAGFSRWLATVSGGALGGDPSGDLNGANAIANEGGGGGGGAASGNGQAGNGGNGAYPGGGGGGGGSSVSGFNSGAGGDGAPGFVKVVCW